MIIYHPCLLNVMLYTLELQKWPMISQRPRNSIICLSFSNDKYSVGPFLESRERASNEQHAYTVIGHSLIYSITLELL